jgi:ribose transport system permease protein
MHQQEGHTVSNLTRLRKALSVGNIGVIYFWLLIVIIFSFWLPDLFPTADTVKAIAANLNISGLAALAILLPMAAGAFDASVGGTISLTSVTCAWFLINTGLPYWIVVLLSIGAGGLVGLANALAVVALRIPALIATLAMWLIADSFSVAVSGNQTITSERVSGDFTKIANTTWVFAAPFFYLLAITVIMAVFMHNTAGGRLVYAVGFDLNVARLAGVRVKTIQALSLVAAGMIAGFAGIILTSRVASATPSSGGSYLLPAFAAAFLGATQFKSKRFNPVGTLIAVFMLGTGQYGLLLAGAPQWMPNIFQGVALIAAIGMTQLQDPSRPRLRRRRQSVDAGPAQQGSPSREVVAATSGDRIPLS